MKPSALPNHQALLLSLYKHTHQQVIDVTDTKAPVLHQPFSSFLSELP